MKILVIFDDQWEANSYLNEHPEKSRALYVFHNELRQKYKHSDVREATWDEVWSLFWEVCEGLEL